MTSKCQKIKKKLLKLDFIGPEYFLESNDTSRFQSFQGLFWSFLAVTTCITIGYMFGKEIYQRKSPNVSISQEFVSYSDVYVNEFPIMFSFISTNGTSLSAKNIHKYYEPLIYFVSMNTNGQVLDIDKYYDFEDCDPTHYSKYSDLVKVKMAEKPNINYLCMKHDDNSMFSNSYFAVNSTNLNYKIKKCNTTRASSNCADDLPTTVQDMLITITYVTSFVDFYDFGDPVNTYLDELTTQASLYLTRRSYLRFVYNAFESDNGILLEDKSRKEFIYLDSLVPDDLLLNYQGPDTDVLFWLALESPKLRNLIARSYMKVQDLLAKIGGLVNAIIIICRIITYHYLRYLYLFSLKECAMDAVHQNELEQSIMNNMNNSKIKNINFEVSNFKLKENVNFEEPSIIKPNNNSNNASPKTKIHHVPDDMDDSVKHFNFIQQNKDLPHSNMNVNMNNIQNNNNISNNVDMNNYPKLQHLGKDKMKNSNTEFSPNIIKFQAKDNNNNNDIIGIFKDVHSKLKSKDKSTKERVDVKSTNYNANSSNAASSNNAYNINNLFKKDSDVFIPEKELEVLKRFNTKKSFFSPSVVSKLLVQKEDLNYFEYLKSSICCDKITYNKYEIQMKAVRKILSIHTYSKLVIAQYNPTNENSALLEQDV